MDTVRTPVAVTNQPGNLEVRWVVFTSYEVLTVTLLYSTSSYADLGVKSL